MKAERVVEMAASSGIELWVEGDRIRYRAPAGADVTSLRTAVAECRPELLAYLRGERVCAHCGATNTIMLVLDGGEHGEWFLCAPCWKEGSR